MTAAVFDPRICALGEGPLWHPLRKQLFWFDITDKKLLTQQNGTPHEWLFDEYVSAAGWIDETYLLIASQTGLWNFDLETGAKDLVTPLEADQPLTRSNDGRADPWGGFWIGTMGINTEEGLGSIYRYYKGTLRKLLGDITITNSIAFSPDRSCAYFTDTRSRKIMQLSLEVLDGWPDGEPQVFVDLGAEGLNPDGSVVDREGHLWNAQWGAGRVARYAPDGTFVQAVEVAAAQATCPAFGGDDLKTMFITSAAQGRDGAADGQTFVQRTDVQGQSEHRVIV